MAINRPSSAPLFTQSPWYVADLTEDIDPDLVLRKRGANQFLGDDAAHHDGYVNLADNGNRVQDGALSLINRTSPLGTPDQAYPAGRRTS